MRNYLVSFVLSIVPFVTTVRQSLGQPITIGVSLPLSGEAAAYGADIKNALIFANDLLGSGKYDLIFEDDRCDNKESVSVAQQLLRIRKVRGVLGFPCSGALLSAAPLFERNKTVVISAGASAPEISNAGEYIFRTVPSDATSLQILVDFLDRKHSKVMILSEETSYCEGQVSILKQSHPSMVQLDFVDPVPVSSDIRSYVSRTLARKPEAILLNTQSEVGLKSLYKEIRKFDRSVQIYGIYFPGSAAFYESPDIDPDGMTFVDSPDIEQLVDPRYRSIYHDYLARFGPPKSVPLFFVTAFNSYVALTRAIETGRDVKVSLSELTFDGANGKFSFDEHGDVRGIYTVLKRFRGRKAEIIKTPVVTIHHE